MSHNTEVYKYLQIERPILDGAEEFLERVAEIGRLVLGKEVSTSLPSDHIGDEADFMNGKIDLVTTLVPVYRSRIEVFRQEDLRLPLLRRVSHGKNTPNYAAIAGTYDKKRRGFTCDPSEKGSSSSSVLDSINNIAKTDNYGNEIEMYNTGLLFDKLVEVDDPIIGHGLGLVPKLGQDATAILGQQAKKTREHLEKDSPRIGSGDMWTPSIPFIRIPDKIKTEERNRLINGLVDELKNPIWIFLGAANTSSGTGRGSR